MSQYINPIEQLIHSTVRIICEDGKGAQSFGTGYIFFFCEKVDMKYPCIVTNKHVVDGAQKGTFNLTLRDENGEPKLGEYETVTLDNFSQHWWPHPNPLIDLVIIPIGEVLNRAMRDSRYYYYVPLTKATFTEEIKEFDQVNTMEEIVMIGYPNGIWDAKHNLPIVRRGITATHPKLPLNGKPEFLIDAACFPGSSGSPVFIANIGSYLDGSGALIPGWRIALLGTLYAGPQHKVTGDVEVIEIPTDTKEVPIGYIPNNLGYVIHASELLAFESVIESQIYSPVGQSRTSLCNCGSGKRYKNCCGRLT